MNLKEFIHYVQQVDCVVGALFKKEASFFFSEIT